MKPRFGIEIIASHGIQPSAFWMSTTFEKLSGFVWISRSTSCARNIITLIFKMHSAHQHNISPLFVHAFDFSLILGYFVIGT